MKQIFVSLSVLLIFVITIIILKQLHKNTIPNTSIINVSAITSPCSLAINYQGDIIASGGFYGDLCIWDRSSGTLIDRVVLREKKGRTDPVLRTLDFHPCDFIIATNREKNEIVFWDYHKKSITSEVSRQNWTAQ